MTLTQVLEEREAAYGLLYALYSYPVARETLEMLARVASDDVGILQDLHALQAMLGEAGNLDEFTEAVEVDYTSLFEGPTAPAPPYASFWLNGGTLMGEETRAVRRAYLGWNMALGPQVRLPEDHISLELAFMGGLSRRAYAALARGDEPECARMLDDQARFLQQHVLTWVPRFCAAVIAAAPDGFYARVCRLADTIIDADYGWLAEPGVLGGHTGACALGRS